MSVNRTNQNKTKTEKLSRSHFIPVQNVKSAETRTFLKELMRIKCSKECLLFSLGHMLTEEARKAMTQPYIEFIEEYSHFGIADLPELPKNIEFDLLGSAYQYLNTKTENLTKGTFYTGNNIASTFVDDLDFSQGQTILDPACGSGAFLFASDADAEQIIGVDIDPIAIMISKFNYFIKFPETQHRPKLYCQDFFSWFETNHTKYNYVIGNPPYGADIALPATVKNSTSIKSGESFSYFVEYSIDLAKDVFRFLLPESFLNVKKHMDIRDCILASNRSVRIRKYSKNFASVMSDTYMLELTVDNMALQDGKCLQNSEQEVVFEFDGARVAVPKAFYRNMPNHILVPYDGSEIALISKVKEKGRYYLPADAFALGIVTGSNDKILAETISDNTEPIYSGKEIQPGHYTFLPPKRYIAFDRTKLQQVAPDRYYRNKPKIVYKAISKKIHAVLDDTGALTTNSANIILPKIQNISACTLLALLNSRVFSYFRLKIFGGANKVSKQALMALPFPEISQGKQKRIDNTVLTIVNAEKQGDFSASTTSQSELQRFIEVDVYQLSAEESSLLDEAIGPLC